MIERRVIKDALSDDNVIEILQELGSSSPVRANNSLIFDTICHNSAGSGSRKLYYYMDTKLFRCYTGCGEVFDVFDLIARVFRQRNIELSLTQSILWTQNRIKIDYFAAAQSEVACSDMEFKREINFYDGQILNYLSFYPVKDWKEEGISIDTMLKYNIKFNPVTSAVVIPHYDVDKNLIGIRQRTMAEDEEVLGKYRPAYINGKTYPHPLSFNLYGIDLNSDNIKEQKKAIVFEGEKSVLKMDIFSNSCAVACCGSNLSAVQVELLLSLGVEEIVIAFDKEFLESGDSLFEKQVKALQSIHSKFSSKVLVSFIFDKFNKLGYKESPIDRGVETFEFLYKKRFSL
jgi:hypothetical protein